MGSAIRWGRSSGRCSALFDRNLPDLHAQVEACLFKTAYRTCHRNQLQTARLLGISRNVVRARLIELGEIPGGDRRGELTAE